MAQLGDLKPGTTATLPDGRRCLVVGRISGSPLVLYGGEPPRTGPFSLEPDLEVEDVAERTYRRVAQGGDGVDPLRAGDLDRRPLGRRGKRGK